MRVVKKREAYPFKIPKSVSLVMVDVETGLPSNEKNKKLIYESFKENDNFMIELEKLKGKNRLGSYDSKNDEKVLKFY